MSTAQEDTRPLAPLPERPPAQPPQPPAPAPGPPRRAPQRRDQGSCLYQALGGLALVALALLIVALAGLAGWTSGQQEAQEIVAVTQAARVSDQIARIPADVAAGNTQLLAARLKFLAELTPAVAGLPQLRLTATTLAQPTATLTPGPTATPTITATVVAPQTVQWQPDELWRQARAAIGLGDYQEGVDLLQALEALAPDYRPQAVRELILATLTKQAQRLFRSEERLAEAILVTDEAIRYGLSRDSGLRYERHVAVLYLEARSMLTRGPAAAVPALRALHEVAPGYRNGEARQLLVEQYAEWAELLLAQGDACAALEQLQQALTLRADAGLALRRDEIGQVCSGTLLPTAAALPGQQPAPGATLPVGSYFTAPGS